MGRGVIYHVVKDPYALGNMDETCFYNMNNVDYVMNQDPEQAELSIDTLRQQLEAAGLRILNQQDLEKQMDTSDFESDLAFAFAIDDTNHLAACQDGFFKGYYETFLKYVQSLTLRQFASDTAVIFNLQSCMDDKFDDAVYLDMGTGPAVYDMMRFIRTMEPGVYYVDTATVYMY